MKRTVRTRALLDTLDITEKIADNDADAANRFLTAVQEAYELVSRFPYLGTLWQPRRTKVPGLRWTVVRGFADYLVFYRVLDDKIDVLRVLHGARHLRREFG